MIKHVNISLSYKMWSEWRDLNSRSRDPKSRAVDQTGPHPEKALRWIIILTVPHRDQVVSAGGFEPPTLRLSVANSTN